MFVIFNLRLNHNTSNTWKNTSIWYNYKLQTVIPVCPVSDHHANPSQHKHIRRTTLCICIIMHELLYHPGVKDSLCQSMLVLMHHSLIMHEREKKEEMELTLRMKLSPRPRSLVHGRFWWVYAAGHSNVHLCAGWDSHRVIWPSEYRPNHWDRGGMDHTKSFMSHTQGVIYLIRTSVFPVEEWR